MAAVLPMCSVIYSAMRRPLSISSRLRGGRAATTVSSSQESGLLGSTLTYFGLAGRGEPIRLAYHMGGIDFVDKRVSFSEWPDLKHTTPWGQLPVLALADGTEIGQNRAILRLVGKQTGLYPMDDFEAAKVDSVLDACDEVFDIVIKEDEENRPTSAANGNIATRFGCIESIIGEEFAVGNSLTIADLAVFSVMGTVTGTIFPNMTFAMLEPYPKVSAIRKMVATHPQVLDWYVKQAELPYWKDSKDLYKVFLAENL